MQKPEKEKVGRKWFDGKDEAVVVAKLEEAWALGYSDAEAASLADTNKSSLCRYLQSHPAVVQRKEQLKERPVLAARSTLLKAIQGGDGDLALKFLERKRRDEFATRSEISETSHIVVQTADDKKALEDAE